MSGEHESDAVGLALVARRAGFGVSASFIVGFVRVVIVGQEWLRQVQQSSRTRGTDSIGDAICLMVLQLLGSNLESGDRARE